MFALVFWSIVVCIFLQTVRKELHKNSLLRKKNKNVLRLGKTRIDTNGKLDLL